MTILLIFCLACAPAVQAEEVVNRQPEFELARYEYAQVHMGTRFNLVIYSTDRQAANAGAQAAFDRIAALDKALSDYDPHSELSRLSAGSPTAAPVHVSNELWPVLCRSQHLARQTDGTFDVTAGPFTALWRISRKAGRLPSSVQLAAARQAVGFANLKLDASEKTARLLRPNMRLDLGGIAKGYAADEALRVLADRGLMRSLVAAGGDIRVGAAPPEKKSWTVAIAPLRNDAGSILSPGLTLRLADAAVSTSGESEQHVDIDGVRYSHIVDPRTGLGLTTRTYVTVVAPNGMTSDSLATAVSVLGPTAGIALLRATQGVEGRIVTAKEDKVQTAMTGGFSRLEVEK